MMMRKIWIAIGMLWIIAFFLWGVLAIQVARAQTGSQPVPPQVPIVLEPDEADAFRDIVESTIPPRYTASLIRWYATIIQRWQQQVAQTQRAAPEQETPK